MQPVDVSCLDLTECLIKLLACALTCNTWCFFRFWHKVLFDIGVVSSAEPFQRLVSQGMILGEVCDPCLALLCHYRGDVSGVE